MKINSINSVSYNNKYNKPSFKHTAIPYPEYAKGYVEPKSDKEVVKELFNKLTALFQPSVTKEADKIKASIEQISQPTPVSPKQHLLSVLA